MRQTENTAIVLRYANYRDYDRMLTLLSPTGVSWKCSPGDAGGPNPPC